MSYVYIDIGQVCFKYGLLLDGTKPLHEPVITSAVRAMITDHWILKKGAKLSIRDYALENTVYKMTAISSMPQWVKVKRKYSLETCMDLFKEMYFYLWSAVSAIQGEWR